MDRTLDAQVRETIRVALIEALARCSSVAQAAVSLDVSERTAFRLMAEHLTDTDKAVIAKARQIRLTADTATLMSYQISAEMSKTASSV